MFTLCPWILLRDLFHVLSPVVFTSTITLFLKIACGIDLGKLSKAAYFGFRMTHTYTDLSITVYSLVAHIGV